MMGTSRRPSGAAVADRETSSGVRMIDRRNRSAREVLVRRVTAEFREMLGLRVTSAEASCLFGLRLDICGRLIDRLVRDGVLQRDDEGRYATV